MYEDSRKGPYPQSSYADITTNENLQRFLASKLLRPGANTHPRDVVDVADLRARVLAEAERRRGSEMWIFLFGVSAEIPADEDDHQFAKLLERLYLSAPGNYGKAVLFGDDAANRSKRNDQLFSGVVLVGAPCLSVVATGAVCWLLVRRNAVRKNEK